MTQAEQRESLVQLLDAIQQAAKKLTDQMDGQAAVCKQPQAADVDRGILAPDNLDGRSKRPASLLRDALLNLPPPTH